LQSAQHHPEVVSVEKNLEESGKVADEGLVYAHAPVVVNLAAAIVLGQRAGHAAFKIAPNLDGEIFAVDGLFQSPAELERMREPALDVTSEFGPNAKIAGRLDVPGLEERRRPPARQLFRSPEEVCDLLSSSRNAPARGYMVFVRF
jgi:hypothetical protein